MSAGTCLNLHSYSRQAMGSPPLSVSRTFPQLMQLMLLSKRWWKGCPPSLFFSSFNFPSLFFPHIFAWIKGQSFPRLCIPVTKNILDFDPPNCQFMQPVSLQWKLQIVRVFENLMTTIVARCCCRRKCKGYVWVIMYEDVETHGSIPLMLCLFDSVWC